MPSVERWYVLSSVVRRYISFIVSGTSMNYLFYIISGTVVYLFMPPVERWHVLSSVVRRYISFIVSGTSMNYLLLYHQWYGGISLHAFNGTLVCVIVSGTAVHLFHRQWYVDELSPFISSVVRWYISFMPSVERWYVLSSVVRRYISIIVSGTSMNYLLLYHQCNGGISLSSLVVRRGNILFYIISGTVVYLFHAFSGTLVCVIVSRTAVYLFHRQWYVDELSLFISSVVRWYISSCLQWNVGMCYRQWYGGISLSSSLVRR